jgi:hypothetical protein
VDSLATMGVALADAGLSLADLDLKLVDGSSAVQPGQRLLNVLQGAGPPLAHIEGDLHVAQAAAMSIEPSLVPAAQRATFLKARGSIDTALTALAEIRQLLPPLVELLGGNGLRTYLVEQVNPAELRPGGGFIGSYSVLEADGGSVKLLRSGNGYELSHRVAYGQAGYLPPPGPLHEFVPTASWSFVDSNFFADFPSNAEAAERFVNAQLAKPLDGVLSIDYYVVAAILSVTGPFAVPGYPGVTVTSDNLVPLLIRYDLEQGYTHKAILSAMAGPLLQRILALPPSDWPKLITVLALAAAERHLQAYFNRPMVQDQMDRYGWSGIVNPVDAGDYMMEVESNLGGTKANYFVKRVYTIRLTRVGMVLHHEVIVDIYDNMPASPGVATYYHGYFQLFVSGDASRQHDNLVPPKYASPAPPQGMRMIDGWLPAVAGNGGHKQAVFTYDTPWHQGADGVNRIYWQKQPGTGLDEIHVVWTTDAVAVYKADAVLSQDQVLELAPNGLTVVAGKPGNARIPSLNLSLS